MEFEFEFEFDEQKSEVNRLKHGIDFVAVQAVWLDDNRIRISARTEVEPRAVMVGKIADRHWSVVITIREGRVRIISARKARPREVALYESEGL